MVESLTSIVSCNRKPKKLPYLFHPRKLLQREWNPLIQSIKIYTVPNFGTNNLELHFKLMFSKLTTILASLKILPSHGS